MAREITQEDMFYFSEFEKCTRVMPLDYLQTETAMFFIVEIKDLGKAIGKEATNIQKLSKMFKKRIFVIGDFNDVEMFLRAFFPGITIIHIEVRNIMGQNNVVMTVAEEHRGLAIGKNGEKIKAAKTLLETRFKSALTLRTGKAAQI
ncbi:MAG: NusA-like transcription termination signal-binding factor [Candidatus Micrarchaeota archaeon]